MGKGGRLRKQRAAGAATDAHASLLAAVELIGYSYGAYADCAAASAMLVLTGRHLSYELTPRPVSLLARQRSTDDLAFMGPRATALVPEHDHDRVENFRPGDPDEDTGHMVVTSENPLLMLDANLGQLRGYGMQAPDALVIRIGDTTPENGRWVANAPDLELVYLPDNNDALWDRYQEGLHAMADDAAKLAALIQAGRSTASIRAMLRPRS
ncbi:hypothetical protein EV379_0287 [Microterricola gilva]|uniref:Uncharacterized protein n=1 Tax=Microterricola gilva TaxID=393267 RepID=A0A4Q8AI09_9MICO|nr:hypothetical protein [Microterricola gilva]RZU63998.1 hypothetical protein EV379_0287 [Microterricola gilva]